MDQMDKSVGNGHCRENNINNFAPLYESDNEEGTQHRNNPNTPIILLSVNQKRKKNKGGQKNSNEEYGNDK